MRIRPVAPHGMPRVVPEGGITLDGYFLPEGVSKYDFMLSMQIINSAITTTTIRLLFSHHSMHYT
jgi:hypothetical protein